MSESQIQSLRFDKKGERWTPQECLKWIRKNELKVLKPYEENNDYILFRLKDYHAFRQLKTYEIGDDIFLTMGYQ